MDFDGALRSANRYLDTATFPNATKGQRAMLTELFEKRAGRGLNEIEREALFDLQHSLTNKRQMIEAILDGSVAVVGRRAPGVYHFEARR